MLRAWHRVLDHVDAPKCSVSEAFVRFVQAADPAAFERKFRPPGRKATKQYGASTLERWCERLALRHNRSLYSRIHHRLEVAALTPDDTAEYLRMRLHRVGCDREVFASDNCEGARWNAGIAATALGRWAVARKAWADYGIEIPPGDGPLEMAIGHAGVRVAPDTEPEVVFCKRLDPCRAVVRSVPLPESDRRFGDVVLHDGESRGKRPLGDALIPVFDELQLFHRSEYGTWRVTVDCPSPVERDALLGLFDDADGSVEDWTESIVVLCSKCSLGEPHDEHDEPADQPWRPERQLGLALRDERELRRLRQLGLW